jgi:HEPN domain-containing protein
MTTRQMARSFLRATAILRETERLLGDGAWNLVVRRCQEAVESALICTSGSGTVPTR